MIEPVRPVVDGGRFAPKGLVGEPVAVEADLFTDGHDRVAAALRVRPCGGPWTEHPMAPLGNDRWQARFVPDTTGPWEYELLGWVDHFASWRHAITTRAAAGQDIGTDIEIGLDLLRSMLNGSYDPVIEDACRTLVARDLALLDDPALDDAVWRRQPRTPVAALPRPLPLRIDRLRAGFGAWYEFFPRSTTSPDRRRGTLHDALDRLDHIARMGFDVVYLPPIHPIGTTNRKGRDNAVVAGPDDPGSPWGIGSPAGGHTAVDPDLGTDDDLAALVDGCRDRGLELALDIALQCSPDHPWVRDHPEWFRHRPDGTIQYAENPPKRYQDIYPLDFETAEWRSLWLAVRDVFTHWIDRGVRIFRVDNPHTKPFAFWEWLIGSLLDDHPDVVFLSEAFTRPRVLERLAKVGFSQSYTYFAWRHTSTDLRHYFEDLAERTIDYLRPNAWPNTPDILTAELQTGGRPAFVARAVLAATLAPSWGVYGPAYELAVATPLRPGSEEYLHSEKYEIRCWDLDQPWSLAPFLARLNSIRRAQPALRQLDTLRFHHSDDPWLLAYSKTDPAGRGDPVLVVVNLDPHGDHAGQVDIDWAALGLPYDARYQLVDHLGGATFEWAGARNHVHLSPSGLSAHVFTAHRADVPPEEPPRG